MPPMTEVFCVKHGNDDWFPAERFSKVLDLFLTALDKVRGMAYATSKGLFRIIQFLRIALRSEISNAGRPWHSLMSEFQNIVFRRGRIPNIPIQTRVNWITR